MKSIALLLTFILLILLEFTMISIENYNQAGFTTANSVKFVKNDDTPQLRKDITVSRKPATYNGATKQYSIPEYRVVVRQDTTDGESNPTGQRLTLDLTVRTPLYGDIAQFQEALADLLAIVSDEDFEDSVVRQLFPVECNSCD